MIKKLPYFLLPLALSLGLLPAASHAQQAFQPGYVLPLGADTLRGQVQPLGPQRGQRECVFRASAAASVTYSPAQLRGYGFLPVGPQFRRGRVPRTGADTTTTLRFQEVLAAGRATLLYASDDNANPRYFLQMAGAAAPTELRQLKRRLENEGRATIQTINQFQQVLLTSLSDCPALAPDIRRVRLGEDELVRLVQRYNTCVAPAGTVLPPVAARKTRLTVSVLAGVAFAQRLMLQSGYSYPQFNQTLTTPLTPVPGVQLTLRNARFSRHLGLELGAFLRRRDYQNTSPGRVINSFTVEDRTEAIYGTDVLSLPVTLSWEFGQGTLRPFVFGGANIELQLRARRNELTTYYTNNSRPPSQQVLFDGADTFRMNFLAGAGLITHRPGRHDMGVQARYEFLGHVAPYIYISSSASAVVVLLSYGLSKN